MSLHLKLLDIDHPLTFEESKLRQIEAHALIYLSFTSVFSRIRLILCIVSFYFPGLIHPADVFRRVTFTKVNQNLTEQNPSLAPTVPPREQNGSTSGW